MSQPESPLASVLKALDWSFRLGRFFGTEVRVYGVWLILLFFVVLPWDGLGWLSEWDRALYLSLWVLTLYATVWLHEMGHVAGARRYHIRTPLITLSPLGGLAHMQSAAPHPRGGIVISAAGPATHLVTLAVVWPLSVLVKGQPFAWGPGDARVHLEVIPFLLARLVELNLTLLIFNLLPFYPLDGGSIVRSVLALRMHPNKATLITARIGQVGAVALGVGGFWFLGRFAGGFTLAIAITNWFACQRAVLEARYSEGPYGEPRQPWEEDPEAWKVGEPSAEPPPRRRARARPRDDDAPRGEELDRLLDRVKEVGLAGLTDAERAALLRASEARRAPH
jgi:Zn-dependent protease